MTLPSPATVGDLLAALRAYFGEADVGIVLPDGRTVCLGKTDMLLNVVRLHAGDRAHTFGDGDDESPRSTPGNAPQDTR